MRAASVEEKQAIEAVTRMDRSEMVQWLRRGHDLLVHWFPGLSETGLESPLSACKKIHFNLLHDSAGYYRPPNKYTTLEFLLALKDVEDGFPMAWEICSKCAKRWFERKT